MNRQVKVTACGRLRSLRAGDPGPSNHSHSPSHMPTHEHTCVQSHVRAYASPTRSPPHTPTFTHTRVHTQSCSDTPQLLSQRSSTALRHGVLTFASFGPS